MHHHAVCKLASDWLFLPSLAKKFEPFFHLQLTLGRGNSSRTTLFYFIFLRHVLWVVVFSVILYILVSQPLVYGEEKVQFTFTKS